MGRTLETLKLGEGRRSPLVLPKPVETTPVQDCVVDWEIGAEVPFVEVGGPNKKVELSPNLTKHAPQTVPQAPHLPIADEPPAIVSLVEMKPMTAALAPWPASAPKSVSSDIIAYHQPDHAASKAYLELFRSMRGTLKSDAANVLLLVGIRPQVGASTVLLNLAVCAATKCDLRTVVVDANFAHAGLAKRLSLEESAGLLEVIAGTVALEKALVKTGIAGLHLVPAGRADLAKDAVTSEAMAWLITCLRNRYDLIFVDGPRMAEQADLAAQIPLADGVYLVAPRSETNVLDKAIIASINRMGGRLCGLIHTHFEM